MIFQGTKGAADLICGYMTVTRCVQINLVEGCSTWLHTRYHIAVMNLLGCGDMSDWAQNTMGWWLNLRMQNGVPCFMQSAEGYQGPSPDKGGFPLIPTGCQAPRHTRARLHRGFCRLAKEPGQKQRHQLLTELRHTDLDSENVMVTCGGIWLAAPSADVLVQDTLPHAYRIRKRQYAVCHTI